MVKIKFYVGQSDPQGQPMQAVAKEWDTTQRLLLQTYGGFSMNAVTGGWFSALQNKGRIETTVVVEVVTEDDDPVKVERVAKEIKALFQQESLLFTVEEVKGRFV